jgi:hypothetical protein
VDVFNSGPVHADPLPGCLSSQGVALINEREDDGTHPTPDAFRVNLEIWGNRHEGTGKQGVRSQFRGQVLTDHTLLVHRGDPTELGPGESLDGAEFDKLAKQGPDNI